MGQEGAWGGKGEVAGNVEGKAGEEVITETAVVKMSEAAEGLVR